ncbi:hypothetical protein [Streptomyces sp. NPDC086182]|jgi:hypothetical protein|uniref:hypothetical protein n=1 Tax=Streptomyces sp. NPDC086182 TaxID=3155058 RepID=UPI00343A09FD
MPKTEEYSMATGPADTADTAASAYGPVALVLGIASTAAAALIAFVGLAIPLLTGLLAVTFGILGITRKLHRKQSLIGLIGGSVGVLSVVAVISAFGA